MLDFIKKYFTKIPVGLRFGAWVVMAFGAVLSFFTINSAFADKHHMNGFFTLLGIVLSVLVVLIGFIANSENTDEKPR